VAKAFSIFGSRARPWAVAYRAKNSRKFEDRSSMWRSHEVSYMEMRGKELRADIEYFFSAPSAGALGLRIRQ